MGLHQVTRRSVSDQVIAQMEQTFSADSIPSVEEIQDMVERVLIDNGFVLIAKDYILYRAEHTKIRNAEPYLMDIYKKLTYSPAIEEDIKREAEVKPN